MVALSDSSVISESSAFTTSPTLIRTSMTGTSLKSPMSGTLISTMSLIGFSFQLDFVHHDGRTRGRIELDTGGDAGFGDPRR